MGILELVLNHEQTQLQKQDVHVYFTEHLLQVEYNTHFLSKCAILMGDLEPLIEWIHNKTAYQNVVSLSYFLLKYILLVHECVSI